MPSVPVVRREIVEKRLVYALTEGRRRHAVRVVLSSGQMHRMEVIEEREVELCADPWEPEVLAGELAEAAYAACAAQGVALLCLWEFWARDAEKPCASARVKIQEDGGPVPPGYDPAAALMAHGSHERANVLLSELVRNLSTRLVESNDSQGRAWAEIVRSAQESARAAEARAVAAELRAQAAESAHRASELQVLDAQKDARAAATIATEEIEKSERKSHRISAQEQITDLIVGKIVERAAPIVEKALDGASSSIFGKSNGAGAPAAASPVVAAITEGVTSGT